MTFDFEVRLKRKIEKNPGNIEVSSDHNTIGFAIGSNTNIKITLFIYEDLKDLVTEFVCKPRRLG